MNMAQAKRAVEELLEGYARLRSLPALTEAQQERLAQQLVKLRTLVALYRHQVDKEIKGMVSVLQYC